MFHFYKKRYGINHRKVVILLSGWHSTQSQYWLFSKIIEKRGYYCLTYTYDKEILDPNPQRTVENISLVAEDIVKEISQLKKQGRSDFSIFGTSLGTVPAIIAANEISEVDKLILNTSGSDLAKTVWSWDNVIKGFKEELVRSGITLEKLTQEWKSINPKNNLTKLKDKKILLLASKKDTIIPFEQTDELRKALQKIHTSTIFKSTNMFGHVSFGAMNLFKVSHYLAVLDNS